MATLLTVYYASIARSEITQVRLDVTRINSLVGSLDEEYIANGTTSFIMSAQPNQNNDTVVGASFISETGGNKILDRNVSIGLNTTFSVAAIFNASSLTSVSFLNLLLIELPKDYRLLNDSMNRKLVSSVIVAELRENNRPVNQIDIHLYFTKQFNDTENEADDKLFCAYYDDNQSSWNDKGCSKPIFDRNFSRYNCTCNHLSSFALIWLPSSSSGPTLGPEGIASLVCQSFSIVCFLVLIIHSLVASTIIPNVKLQATQLLPLISCASTVLLFIFYIALVLIVNTKTQSSGEQPCFPSATVLMYFVYFFILFMFCCKTSVAYFNYIRFVHLFPPPSLKQLYILLTISFILSITVVAFMAGFNSNSSFSLIILYPYQICWFQKHLIYYFMLIPTGIFLLINIFVLVLVGKRITDHARHATSRHQSYQRMKLCVLFLISSSISQGIGWIIGPFLLAFSSFSWVFVLCCGLEGVWAILIYIIMRQQHIDEQKHVIAAKELAKVKRLSQRKTKRMNSNSTRRKLEVISQSPNRELYWFDNLPYILRLNFSPEEYDA